MIEILILLLAALIVWGAWAWLGWWAVLIGAVAIIGLLLFVFVIYAKGMAS
jgi:hypothetical protein